jgi:DNA-binding MarR family transcriptional regulator
MAKKDPAGAAETKDYILEEQAGFLLRRAHQRSTAIFKDIMADLELTPRQFSALIKIMEGGAVSQNRLGRLTAMDPATMQGVVRRLDERGLVARRADPTDRRRTLLSLTAAGHAFVEAGLGARGSQVTAATLAPLRPSERATFLRLLKKLT